MDGRTYVRTDRFGTPPGGNISASLSSLCSISAFSFWVFGRTYGRTDRFPHPGGEYLNISPSLSLVFALSISAFSFCVLSSLARICYACYAHVTAL